MNPAFQANNRRTWFQRIMQEGFFRRFCVCFYLFYAAVIILLLGNILVALFSGHTPFSLEMTMIATGIVFFFLTGLMHLYEASRISAFIQEKISRKRIARDPSEALEVEEPTVTT